MKNGSNFLNHDTLIRTLTCKTEQPLKGMKPQEKEERDEKHIGKLFRENPETKGVY